MFGYPESDDTREVTSEPLNPELYRFALETAQYIRFADDTISLRMIEDLNRKAEQDEMIGEFLRLQSQTIIQTQFGLNRDGELEEAPCVDHSRGDTIEGMFVGFEQYVYENQRMLMYRLETVGDDIETAIEVVNTPVLDTNASIVERRNDVMFEPPVNKELIDFVINEPDAFRSIKKLVTVNDTRFQRTIHELLLHFDDTRPMKAATLARVGRLVTKLINYPLVAGDEEIEDAILELLISKLPTGDRYLITGDLLSKSEMGEGNTAIGVDIGRALMRINSFALIDNYTRHEGVTNFSSNRLQPAFVYNGGDDRYFYIPLVHVTSFMQIPDDYHSCLQSLIRYRSGLTPLGARYETPDLY
jgi:hypothetical protein